MTSSKIKDRAISTAASEGRVSRPENGGAINAAKQNIMNRKPVILKK